MFIRPQGKGNAAADTRCKCFNSKFEDAPSCNIVMKLLLLSAPKLGNVYRADAISLRIEINNGYADEVPLEVRPWSCHVRATQTGKLSENHKVAGMNLFCRRTHLQHSHEAVVAVHLLGQSWFSKCGFEHLLL